VGVDWPLCVPPQPWREIDAHGYFRIYVPDNVRGRRGCVDVAVVGRLKQILCCLYHRPDDLSAADDDDDDDDDDDAIAAHNR